jgi:glycosyltransferase involved in cell wall biosynthesis
MVVTEALARGLPVVASDVGGVREALGDGGMLVPPGDPDALADALRQWLTDDALRASLRSAARSRRTTLAGWDRTVSLVSQALEALG